MFDRIPIEEYTPKFYNAMLVLTLVVAFHSLSFDIRNKKRLAELSVFGIILMIFVILYMGFRPISGWIFGDMETYNKIYTEIQNGGYFEEKGDLLFYFIMRVCAKVMDAKYFFLIVDILYVVPMYLFSKKHFKRYWFFCFFMLMASFSFWTYGTNGLRNGLATSFFLWGLVYYKDNKWLMYVFFAFGFMMHKSLIITLSAFAIAYFLRNKPKVLLAGWLIAIPVSLISGSFWNNFFDNLGIFTDRSEKYLSSNEKTLEQFSATGFRWDFVLYSSVAIFAGWYFIIDRKLKDKFYIQLFGTYAVANTFWILVIRAAFSNRFAYLSWFMMAPVIIYPLCKYQIIKDQYRTMGTIILVYYLFTYYMIML